MTTLNQLMDRLPVEQIESRAAARDPVDWHRVRMALGALVPMLLGLAVGFVVRASRFTAAAFLEGFDRGRTGPVARNAIRVTPTVPRSATVTREG